jgi:hypothetical protein
MSNKLVAQAATYTTRLHKRQTSMPPAGFEPTIPAIQRPRARTLDRTASGIGHHHYQSDEIARGHKTVKGTRAKKS